MALKLKGSTSGFVALDSPAVAGNNTITLPDSNGSANQVWANDNTAGVTTYTQVTINRNGDIVTPGTLSIGGTITYEDVTNVDSVGIITARTDIHLGDKLVHYGDTNTAIRFPSADTITAETAGNERLRITSGGKVGINTNASAAWLNIHQGDSGTVDAIIITNTSTTNNGLSLGVSSVEDAFFWNGSNTNMTFATNNTERLRINNSGQFLVGVTAARTMLSGYTPSLQVEGTANSDSSVSIVENVSASSGPSLWFGKTRGSSLGANTVVQSGDELGTIVFNGADGTDVQSMGAYIRASVDGTPGSNDMPGRITIHTTADGAASPTERLRIASDGTLTYRTGGGKGYDFNSSGSSAGVANMFCPASYTIAFGTNNNERLRIHSSGQVSIGTTIEGNANADDLTVATTGTTGITVRSGSSNTGNIYFSDATSGSGEFAGAVEYSHSTNSLQLHSNSNERLRITSNGDVGINTTGVSYSDHVYLSIRGKSTDRGGVVHVGNSDHSVTAQFSVYDSKAWVHTGSSHNLVFGTGGANQHVTIDTSGRMIISANSNFANASIDDLQVGNNSSATQRGITIGSTDECAIAFADAGDARAGSITYNHGSDMMLFKTDGQNTRFDLDNNQATFYPAITKSFRIRKNGHLDNANDQCIASFWSPSQTAANDKGYISISSSTEGVYGCHVGFVNDQSNPSWLNPGFYVATGHNTYLPADHQMRFKISSSGVFYGSSTTITSISDARLKKNITNYTYDLNKFKQLQPKTFEWINPSAHDDTVRRGFSAQEVESVDDYWILEDRIDKDSKDKDLLDADLIAKQSKLGELDAMYVSVINQLISKIETLETKVAALESA